MILSRRSLITGLTSLLAAPALVRATSIMPVKPWVDDIVAFISPSHPELVMVARNARYLGLAQMKVEGAPVVFDGGVEMYHTAPDQSIYAGDAVYLGYDGWVRRTDTQRSVLIGVALSDSHASID